MKTRDPLISLPSALLATILLAACNPPPKPTTPLAIASNIVNAVPRDKYKAGAFIQVASDLQATGQKAALEILNTALQKQKTPPRSDPGWNVIILCRMVFTNRPGEPFRRPGIGATGFLGDSNFSQWPLSPIEIVDGVPFLVTTEFTIAGQVESPEAYLSYCTSNCIWNPQRFSPKSSREMKTALKKMIASPKWKTPLDDWEKDFLTDQIK